MLKSGNDDFDLDEHFVEFIERFVGEGVGSIQARSQSEIDDYLENEFQSELEKAIYSQADGIAEDIVENASEYATARQKQQLEYETFVAESWEPAFTLLRVFIIATIEAANDFIVRHRARDNAQDPVLGTVIDLHGRAIRLANEAALLMRSGYAEAALARWRVLHEVTVISMFLEKHGSEMVERYLDHEAVEAWHAMEELQARVDRVGCQRFDPQEIDDTRTAYELMIQKYGKSFKSQYGWAASIIDGRFGFRHIEEDVALDHLRPWYRYASHQMHGNPKGMLGHRVLSEQGNAVLVGPNITGMADPGALVSISMLCVTCQLLSMRDDTSRVFVMATLKKLRDLVEEEFNACQQSADAAVRAYEQSFADTATSPRQLKS